MITNTRKLSSLLLSVSMLVCTVPAAQADITTHIKDFGTQVWENKAVTIPGAALLASLVLLYSRVPKKTAKPEYEFKKLISNPLSFNYWKNVWAIYRDGFVGQCSKSASLKADLETGNITPGETAESFGLLGKTNDYLKASETAIKTIGKTVAVVGGIYWVANGGISKLTKNNLETNGKKLFGF